MGAKCWVRGLERWGKLLAIFRLWLGKVLRYLIWLVLLRVGDWT